MAQIPASSISQPDISASSDIPAGDQNGAEQPDGIQSTLAPDKPNGRAIANLFIALMAVSFAPIFIRFSETDLGPNGTVLNRMLVFVIVFGLGRSLRHLWQKWHQAKTSNDNEPDHGTKDGTTPPITVIQWILLVSVGIVSATTLALWAISLVYTSVAKSMLLNNLTPVFASAGSWLFLGKRFDRKFIVGVAIAVAGAILLGIEDLHGGEVDSLIGDAYALLSAVFLGTYFLLVEQLRTRFDSTTILLSRCAIGSVLLIPLVGMAEGQLLPSTWVSLLAVIGLGIISEGLGQNLLANGMAQFSASFIALFLLLEPIVSALLGWFIFAESLSPVTGVGFAVILGGIYIAKSSHSATQSASH
ncbi:MAG: DMT family transporter [Leptolyngbyaceae bacterium]|nr:DMT family transporter [Leptolyngbyaceae bacterium]